MKVQWKKVRKASWLSTLAVMAQLLLSWAPLSLPVPLEVRLELGSLRLLQRQVQKKVTLLALLFARRLAIVQPPKV